VTVRPIHCEALTTWFDGDKTLCSLPREDLLVWATREFAFGIRHPDLAGKLCEACIAKLRAFINEPTAPKT
jgi:hypothetical protein